MKQTAVKWYNSKVIELMTQREQGNIDVLEFRNQLDLLFEQAEQLEEEQNFQLAKRCFYKGFEKAENDDGNCFTAWREEAPELLSFKSEQ